MTFQQYQGHLDGLRLAIAPGSTPDPDGVLWNTDGAAQYVANVLESIGLGNTFTRREVLSFTGSDFENVPNSELAIAQRDLALGEAGTTVLLLSAVGLIPLAQAERPSAFVYTTGGGLAGALWRPLTYLEVGPSLVPGAEPVESDVQSVLSPSFVQPAYQLPAWIYSPAPEEQPVVSVTLRSESPNVSPDAVVDIVLVVAAVGPLPLVPPFPR